MSTPAVLSPALSWVVARLDKSTWIQEHGRVFGSLLERPSQARDVDVGVVVDKPLTDTSQLDSFKKLLRVAGRGTPSYGCLDLFVAFSNTLMVRDDECRGFVRAKNARELRKALAAGEPWAQWRARVQLDPGVQAELDKPKLYFAHPISSYHQPEALRAVETLQAAGYRVTNPSEPRHFAACGRDMKRWVQLARTCDALAFLPFPDGTVSAGVAMEADAMRAAGKKLFQMDATGTTLSLVLDWPKGFKRLSIEQTRERLRQAKASPTAVRKPGM